MNDDFTQKLFEIAVDSPSLQQAILNSMGTESTESGGYSIPTGDIHLQIFKDGTPPQSLVNAIKKADSLTVAQLGKILAELSTALTVKEIEGEALLPYEQTLKDIDISCLATFALVTWAKRVKHPEG